MQTSSVIFFEKDNEGNGCYYKHFELGLINTYESAAYSVMVSLAEYIVWRFPTLQCPGFVYDSTKIDIRLDSFPNYAATTHQMYLSWIHLFIQAIECGNSIRNNKNCYYKVQISKEYGKLLESEGFEKIQFQGDFKWNLISPQLTELKPIQQRPIIIYATCSKQEVRPFFYGELFNNQKWIYFDILKGNLPTVLELTLASAVIVPGGQRSVYQETIEIQTFSNSLSLALNSNKKLKYLGICFGAQLLTYSLGGKVGKSRKVHSGMLNMEVISNKRKNVPFSQFKQFFNSPRYKVLQFHGDQIKQLPPNFEVIATSCCTKNQIIVSKDGRFLGIQAHPQYGVQRSRMCQLHQVIYKNGSQQQIQSILDRKVQLDNTVVIRRMMSNFLNCQ